MNRIGTLDEKHVTAMARLMRNAYPGYDITDEAQQNTEKWVKRLVSNASDEIGLGFFDESNQLLGGIQVLNRPMNLRMEEVNVIGLGGLCVDLLHKKKGIALKLLEHAFITGKNNGASMAILDPFNIGFYKKMGCGISIKKHQFKLRPSQFSNVGDGSLVSELKDEHFSSIMEYIHRYYLLHHGMLKMEEYEMQDILKTGLMTLGVWQQGQLSGIMTIRFERKAPPDLFKTNLVVEGFLYDDHMTAQAFMSFLNAQKDQVNQVIFTSQDNHFELNFQDPDTGDDETFHTRSNEMYRTGSGMMARILNVEKVLATVSVPAHERNHFPVTIHIDDPLIEKLSGVWTLEAKEGKLRAYSADRTTKPDGTITIADLASVIMGAASIGSLVTYGLLVVHNHEKIEALGRVLQYHQSPVCLSRF